LTPIQLSAQRLHRRYHKNPGDFPNLLEQCTETIITEVNGLRHLLDEFSQLASDASPRNIYSCLNEIIEATIDVFAESPHNIEVRMHATAHLPAVLADRKYLKRAFLNLIQNGLESMAEIPQGILTIHAFPSTDRSKVFVRFSDTGPGIPADTPSKLFTPNVSTKKDGMGLAVVKKIMIDLGGDIRLEETQVGQIGTTFSLWLKTE